MSIASHLPPGSSPIVVHAAGRSTREGPLWSEALSRSESLGSLSNCPDLTIVTFNTTDELGVLERQCGQYDLDCHVLGRGVEPWQNRDKLRLVAEFLTGVQTPYVMGLDGFDVVLLGPPGEALARFKRYGVPLLFNAEKRFWPMLGPETELWKDWEECVADPPFRFMNSGCWIGETRFCREFFAAAAASRLIEGLVEEGRVDPCLPDSTCPATYSDQLLLHGLYCTEYGESIGVDSSGGIFLNLANLAEGDGAT